MRRSVPSPAFATIAAVAANAALFAAGNAADASFVVAGRNEDAAPMEIGVASVVIATVLPLLIGVGVTAFAVRRSPGTARRLRIASIVLAVVSLAAPLTADTDNGTRLWLALMHVVAAAAYLAATRRTTTAATRAHAAAPAGGTAVGANA